MPPQGEYACSISLGISLASLAVALLAAVFSYRQVWQAKVANSIPVVLGLLGEFTETRRERYFVIQELSGYDPAMGVWGLPDDARESVLRVLHYLDHLGLLVAEGLADEKAIAGFVGDAIVDLWLALEPYVQSERENRRRDWKVDDVAYQMYFENLAARMVELDPEWIRRHLRPFPACPSDADAA